MAYMYKVPGSLRGLPGIDHVLHYYPYFKEVEDYYISLLQSATNFETKYKSEFASFSQSYRPERPNDPMVEKTVLWKALFDRNTSSKYNEAVREYWYLFSVNQEYQKVDQRYKRQPQLPSNFSQTLVVNPTSGLKGPLRGSYTVHVTGRQQSVDSVLDQGHQSRKYLEEETFQLRQLVESQGEEIKALRKKELENTATIEDLRRSKGRLKRSLHPSMAQVPIKDASWSAEKEKELHSLKEDIKSIEVALERTIKAKQNKESENSALQKRNEQLQREYEEMANKADKLKDEKESIQLQLEQTSRDLEEIRSLSGFAGKQLMEGNPNFTDLSVKYRPTRIAERFHSVYDEEWTNALEVLSSKKTVVKNEEEAIVLLMNIVKDIYNLCNKVIKEQTSNIVMNLLKPCTPKAIKGKENEVNKDAVKKLERQILVLLRENCMEPVLNLTEKFKEHSKDYMEYQKFPEVVKYVEKCVELLCLMATSDPSMILLWPERGDKFNINLFNYYALKGDMVSFAVWPAVLLHEGGPVMNKGYAKPM